MILYEHEGKALLKSAGIPTPKSHVVSSPDEQINLSFPVVIKAQVLSGKRADAGGILFAENTEELKSKLTSLLGQTINSEKVEKVLVEEKIDFTKPYYLSLTYDTDVRAPILSISEEGGTGIEQRQVQKFEINPLSPKQNLPEVLGKDILENAIKLFFDQDLLLLEINPLVQTSDGHWVALDAKIKLDDNASSRHPEWAKYPDRSSPGHTPTKREIEAKKIDEGDYRGVAGSAFFDLPGDIAVMASGGGASLVALDALIQEGGHPANYTEYGGNPPREKVAKLTQIVLDKPNLHGLWVVGALANFTNIYETLSGFIDGLKEAQKRLNTKFNFPIVIRRAGPSDTEAKKMLSEVKDFDLHIYGEEISITRSAKVITKLAKEYKQK